MITFAGLMGYLVFRSLGTQYELVSPEYYKDELSYQKIIDASNRTNGLQNSLEITRDPEGILIQMPQDFRGISVTGTIYFYCPTDSRKDRRFPLRVNSEGRQRIDPKALQSGSYTIKVNWECNQQTYYSEQSLNW